MLASSARSAPPAARAHVIEYAGQAIRDLSMEGRMTVCNMSIEAGARAGLIAPDQTTFDYVRAGPCAQGCAVGGRRSGTGAIPAQRRGRELRQGSHPRCGRDRAAGHLGHLARKMVAPVTGVVPDPETSDADEAGPHAARCDGTRLPWITWASRPGAPDHRHPVDKVFIGSCTNGRIEDLRAAAEVAKGRFASPQRRQALVVPGSGLVKNQAEAEGLDKIFIDAGFEWREPGCSMCLAMNADKLGPGERCASTSNRNFEGRQGYNGRTHLVSPAMAAAAAVHGAPGRRP